jgi:hypothetical protein
MNVTDVSWYLMNEEGQRCSARSSASPHSVSYNSENAVTVAGQSVLAASIGNIAVVSPNNYRYKMRNGHTEIIDMKNEVSEGAEDTSV